MIVSDPHLNSCKFRINNHKSKYTERKSTYRINKILFCLISFNHAEGRGGCAGLMTPLTEFMYPPCAQAAQGRQRKICLFLYLIYILHFYDNFLLASLKPP